MGHGIRVPLGLDGFEVAGEAETQMGLEVRVVSTLQPSCFDCGSERVRGHGSRTRRIRDVGVGRPVTLLWHQRRFKCLDCGRTSRERHHAVAGRRSITKRFREELFERSVVTTFTDVAETESVSYYRVVEAFDHFADQVIADTKKGAPRQISLDESSFLRPFRYFTIVVDPKARDVLEAAPERSKASAVKALKALGEQAIRGIEVVVTDCHNPYRLAVKEVLPHASHVADKFHVLRLVASGVEAVRVEAGRIPGVGKRRQMWSLRSHELRYDPNLRRARFVLRKRFEKMNERDRQVLRLVEEAYPEVYQAWRLMQSFAAIYRSKTRQSAERNFDRWLWEVRASNLDPMIAVSRSVMRWRNEVLNYIDHPETNAFAEGITNKIKVMKRAAYGFRNQGRYRRKVILTVRHRRGRRLLHQES